MIKHQALVFVLTVGSFITVLFVLATNAYATSTFLQGRIWRDTDEDYRRVDTSEPLLSGVSAPQVLMSYNCNTSAGPVGGNAVTNTTLCSGEGTGSYTTPLNTPLIKENITSCTVIAGLTTSGWYFTQNKGHATWASSVCTFGSTQGNDYTGVCAATDPINGKCTRLRVTVPGADIQGTAGYFYLWFGVNMITPTSTVTPTPLPPTVTPTPTMPPSCQNIYDRLMAAFGSSCTNSSQARYDKYADTNNDGSVNIIDFSFFGYNAYNDTWCTAQLADQFDPCAPTPTSTPIEPTSTPGSSLCTPTYPSIPILSSPGESSSIGTTNVILQWQVGSWGVAETNISTPECESNRHFDVYLFKGSDTFDSSFTRTQLYTSQHLVRQVAVTGTATSGSLDVSTLTANPPVWDGSVEWDKWYYWGVVADNGSLQSEDNTLIAGPAPNDSTQPVNFFYVTRNTEWFVTYTGDVHAENQLLNSRPEMNDAGECNTTLFPPYLSAVNDGTGSFSFNAGLYSGLVTYGSSLSAGCFETDANGAVSQELLVSGSAQTNNGLHQSYTTATGLDAVKRSRMYYGYDYYVNHIPPYLFSTLTSSTLTATDIVTGTYFKVNGNVDIGSLTISNVMKKVILVDGSVNLNGAITVDPGGFLAIIANGDIRIDKTLGGSTAAPALQGVFIADGTLYTGSKKPATDEMLHPCNSTSIDFGIFADATLYASGVFIAWTNVELERQISPLCRQVPGNNIVKHDSGHIETPGEVFMYRPDLLLSAPKEFMEQPYAAEEVNS